MAYPARKLILAVLERYEKETGIDHCDCTVDPPLEQDLKDWLVKWEIGTREDREAIQEYAVNNHRYFRIDPSLYG